MLNPAPKGNDQQITVKAAESAALIVVPEKIEFLDALVDKTESIVLSDVQGRLDGEGRHPRQVSDQLQAEGDQPKEQEYEISFLGGALRLAGAIVGFLMGGLAGAAFCSIVGEMVGDTVAERSSITWPNLGRAIFYPKGGHHEEDACDRNSNHALDLERSRCEGRRTADL